MRGPLRTAVVLAPLWLAEPKEPAEPGERSDNRERPDDRVLRPAYALAVRQLITLVTPALVVFLPTGLLAAAALLVVADAPPLVADGGLELAGTPGTPVLVWAAAVIAAGVAGHLVVLPATVILAAGFLTGRRVAVRGALRVSVRRWPATAVLLLAWLAAVAVILGAGAAILLTTGAQVTAYGVMALLALGAAPGLLAVPGVVLDGRSARGALAHAYRDRATAAPFKLSCGVVVLPALVQQVVSWALPDVPVALVSALAVVPFQAAVIARVHLRRSAAVSFPEDAPAPVRPVPVLAALLLPVLLYGTAVLVNPLGWPETDRGPAGPALARLLNCGGEPCAGAWLPDGRLAVTRWHGEIDPYRMVLSLQICDATDCDSGDRTIAEADSLGDHLASAAAARPGGGLVVVRSVEDVVHVISCADRVCARPRATAVATRLSASQPYGLAVAVGADDRPVITGIDPDDGLLTVLACEDPGCSVVREGRPQVRGESGGERRARTAAVIRPGGLPLIVHRDAADGRITLYDCRTRECSASDAVTLAWRGADHPALAVDRSGRAFVAYQDLARDRVVLATCAGTRCTAVPVGTSRDGAWGLVMTLDGRGGPVLTWRDDRIVTVAVR